MTRPNRPASAFGTRLKFWRSVRGTSQLALAQAVDSTPRHISFIETGRSRPRQDLVLRIGEALQLPLRARNDLLQTAGLSPVFSASPLDSSAMKPFREAVARILDAHDPFPGCAVDPKGVVQASNAAFRRFLPGVEGLSAEASIDRLFGEEGKAWLENWPDFAWSQADLRAEQAARSGDPELRRLAERALAYLRDVPRPAVDPDDAAAVAVGARVRHRGEVFSTFASVLRFETARDVTASELRVELIFPADEATRRLFEQDA